MICCLFNETPAPFNPQYRNTEILLHLTHNIAIPKYCSIEPTILQYQNIAPFNPQYPNTKILLHLPTIQQYQSIAPFNPQHRNTKILNTVSQYHLTPIWAKLFPFLRKIVINRSENKVASLKPDQWKNSIKGKILFPIKLLPVLLTTHSYTMNALRQVSSFSDVPHFKPKWLFN